MKTIAMKLVSGEEIIARFIDASPTRNGVTVSHVRTIGLQQGQNGDFGIGMMDYILSDKDCVIEIKNFAVIASYTPSHEVERAYLSNTSGFQLA
jgi:hypothetical protein